MVQIIKNSNQLINTIKYQDLVILKNGKKLKNKKLRKQSSKEYLLAKYFKTRILKKRYGFWLNRKVFCKGFFFLQKLHKKIGFKLPNNRYKKMQKKLLKHGTL